MTRTIKEREDGCVSGNGYTRELKRGFLLKSGFTLIELLVVITIVAILALAVFLNFQDENKKARNAIMLDTKTKIIDGFMNKLATSEIEGCANGMNEVVLSGSTSSVNSCYIQLKAGDSSTNEFLSQLGLSGKFMNYDNVDIPEFSYVKNTDNYEYSFQPFELTASLPGIQETYALSNGKKRLFDTSFKTQDKVLLLNPVLNNVTLGDLIQASNSGTLNALLTNKGLDQVVSSSSGVIKIDWNKPLTSTLLPKDTKDFVNIKIAKNLKQIFDANSSLTQNQKETLINNSFLSGGTIAFNTNPLNALDQYIAFKYDTSIIDSSSSGNNSNTSGTSSTNTGGNGQNNTTLVATLDGKLLFNKYKGINYYPGIINLGIPSGNTVENITINVQNGQITFHQIDGNRLIDVMYQTPSSSSNVTTDKITIEGSYFPSNDSLAQRIAFKSEVSFDLHNPISYTINTLDNNTITNLNTTYNSNLVTIPIPNDQTIANIELLSSNGQIGASAQQSDNQMVFDYTSPSSGTNDTITIKGSYYPKTNPFGENVPFIATISISGLQQVSIVNYSNITGLTDNRSWGASITYNGKIYIIGGMKDWSGVYKFNVYDPITNSYESKADIPIDYGMTAGVIDGKIFVTGGNATGNQLYMYNINGGDSWIEVSTPFPYYVNGTTTISYNGKIYFIGGVNRMNWTILNKIYEFDPNTLVFTEKTSMPGGKVSAGSVLKDGKIYVIGGNENTSSTYVYNILNNTWDTITTNNVSSNGVSCFLLNGKIYSMGGWYDNTIKELSEDGTNFVDKVSLPGGSGPYKRMIGVVGNDAYIFGGESGNDAFKITIQ